MNLKKISAFLVVLMMSTSFLLSAAPEQKKTEEPSLGICIKNASVKVHARLMEVGLTSEDADSRLSLLSDSDIQKLAENPAQLAMGGIEDKTLILIAVILIAPSIILLLLL